MYTSKYSIPLEIQGGAKKPRTKKAQAKAALQEYSWTDVFINLLHFIWSLFAGLFYFFRATWKANPRLKALPWLRLVILGAVAYILLGSNMILDNEPANPEKLGWIWADKQEESTDKAGVATAAKTNPLIENKRTIEKNPVNTSVAPAEPESLAPIEVQDFIQRFAQTAKEEMKQFGIPASIKMGQAIIESQSGNSILAKGSNNFFGIKCKTKCKSCTCRNYEDDDPYDMFRVFDSAWASWREHSKLLCNPRYSKLPLYGNNYKMWARGLKAAGYATDPKYDKKLIAVIEKYNLTSLDR